ncbi:cytotoxic and regulatory T-cell molecule [Hirundo rustica]|uniref:cytotoxic and regulatory T-cell molecule n=1 Tax=Hirundo rustica TaxID=43150 RepID=UPI001A951E40|nr:cytotoxic and regulatory T-cell molecule [Hirundo rustica]
MLLSVPGVLLRVPGVLLTLPGVLLRVPGVLLRVPGVLLRVPGVLLSVPGVLLRVPGVLLTLPGMLLRVPGVLLSVPGVLLSVPGVLLTLPLLLLQGGFPGAACDPVTLKEGENLNLRCTFSTPSSSSNSTLQWLNPQGFTIFLNAQRVLRDQRYKLLRHSEDELSIQLSNVTVQDEGIYSCFYYSSHFKSKSQNVEILAAPSHPVLEVSQDSGRGIKLSCHTQGCKPQPQISWLLDNGIELPGDTRHQLGADGKKWSTSSSLRILSYGPKVTASCAIQHPALRGQRLMASLPFQDLPSTGCNKSTGLSEDAEVPSPSGNPAVPSSPANPGFSSPSASPEDPLTSSTSTSPEDLVASSLSTSQKDPEAPSPSTSPKDPEVSSPSTSPENPGFSNPSASPENPEVSSPSTSQKDPEASSPSAPPEDSAVPSSAPAQPNLPGATSEGTGTAPSANGTEEEPPGTEVSPPRENTTGISTLGMRQSPESKGFVKKEKNLLLPILVAALIFVLLVIVLLFMVKLKKAHGVWKRENDVSEQTLESYKSRSNEESPGHEKNGQAVNPKSNMQYVTEGHVETPEKIPETPEKNPGGKNVAKMFECGRETDV